MFDRMFNALETLLSFIVADAYLSLVFNAGAKKKRAGTISEALQNYLFTKRSIFSCGSFRQHIAKEEKSDTFSKPNK